jgi:cell division protease FtsH
MARDVTVAGRPLNKSVSAELEMQVAVHEIGHALVASLLQPAYKEVVQRVTITPTSNGAGGLTFFAPRRNDGAQGTIATRTDLHQQLVVLLGGRAAEEVVFSTDFVSLGASHDIQEAERIARMMVRSGGMTEALGSPPRISANLAGPRVADAVDSDAQWFVSCAYAEALDLLQRHKTTVLQLAERLVADKSIPGAVVRRSARVATTSATSTIPSSEN